MVVLGVEFVLLVCFLEIVKLVVVSGFDVCGVFEDKYGVCYFVINLWGVEDSRIDIFLVVLVEILVFFVGLMDCWGIWLVWIVVKWLDSVDFL